jgi:hypothetical protein
MSVALTYDMKEMLFGVEITVVSGFVFVVDLIVGTGVLWALGLIGGLFGFWLTLDAYTGRESAVSDGETDDRPEGVPDEAD